jgi:hypothetical protein
MKENSKYVKMFLIKISCLLRKKNPETFFVFEKKQKMKTLDVKNKTKISKRLKGSPRLARPTVTAAMLAEDKETF